MEYKKENNREQEKGDSEGSVERLDPVVVGEEDLDVGFAKEVEMADAAIDQLFEDDPREVDHSIDSLFDEERKTFKKGLRDEVEKALSQPAMSNASLYRMRMNDPSEEALSAEIATQKSVEEIWEEPLDEAKEMQNRKSMRLIFVLIASLFVAGSWALWTSANDERGNEEDLVAQENENKQKELSKLELGKERDKVYARMHEYFSAITVDQKSESIYKVENFQKEIVAYYEQQGGVNPYVEYNIDNMFLIDVAGEDVWEVFVKDMASVEKELKRYFVRKDTDGSYKVDWEADVIFQRDSLSEFQEMRSSKPKNFRFLVEPMHKLATYNWRFKDNEYVPLRLSVPDTDYVFWGYVKRGSDEYEELVKYMDFNLKDVILDVKPVHQFILKVRFLEDSPTENSQYILIEDIVSRKWVNMVE